MSHSPKSGKNFSGINVTIIVAYEGIASSLREEAFCLVLEKGMLEGGELQDEDQTEIISYLSNHCCFYVKCYYLSSFI
jgi:hypothetical protein